MLDSWLRQGPILGLVFFLLILTRRSHFCQQELHAEDVSIYGKITQAWEDTRHCKFDVEITEKWESVLKPSGVNFSWRMSIARNNNVTGVRLERDYPGQSTVPVNVLVFRGLALLRYNGERKKNQEATVDKVTSMQLSDAAISSNESAVIEQEITRNWPAQGNVEPICNGILLGQDITDNGLLSGERSFTQEGTDIIITARNRFGDISLKCDSQTLLPRRIQIVQDNTSVLYGRVIGEIDMNAGNVWPAGKIRKIVYDIEANITSAGSDSNSVPSYIDSWAIKKDTHCAEGVVVHQTIIGKVIAADWSENIDPVTEVLPTAIRVGFPVSVSQAAQLSYVWDGRWAVPQAELLAKSVVQKRPGHLAPFLIGFNILVIGFAVYWITIRRRV